MWIMVVLEAAALMCIESNVKHPCSVCNILPVSKRACVCGWVIVETFYSDWAPMIFSTSVLLHIYRACLWKLSVHIQSISADSPVLRRSSKQVFLLVWKFKMKTFQSQLSHNFNSLCTFLDAINSDFTWLIRYIIPLRNLSLTRGFETKSFNKSLHLITLC